MRAAGTRLIRTPAARAYYQAFLGIFEHANLRTPPWLGYLVQRPESHCVHHRRGVHTYNFSDFPLWDILMGSFRNPREFRGDVGFESPANGRVGAMLVFRDVNEPLYGKDNRGMKPAAEESVQWPGRPPLSSRGA